MLVTSEKIGFICSMGVGIKHVGKYKGKGSHDVKINDKLSTEILCNAIESAKSKALRRACRFFGNYLGLICWTKYSLD